MKIETIGVYIENFPPEVQDRLQKLRAAINEAAPGAVEAIAYQMPTFKLNGKNLVHFAGYQHHIGFYPTPSPIEQFAHELSGYKTSKGAIQFPMDQPLPLELVKRMVAFRVKQIMGS